MSHLSQKKIIPKSYPDILYSEIPIKFGFKMRVLEVIRHHKRFFTIGGLALSVPILGDFSSMEACLVAFDNVDTTREIDFEGLKPSLANYKYCVNGFFEKQLKDLSQLFREAILFAASLIR